MHGSEAMIELALERVEQEREAQIDAIRQAARRQRICDPVNAPLTCRCGEEISELRLRAVPGTRQCVDCAAKSERRVGGWR